MRPGKRRLLNPFIEPEFVAEQVEKMKASIRAKVEHPFRVIKQQFGFGKVRYRGLAEEHGTDRHAVRAVEPVDGAQAADAGRGMSAPAAPEPGSPDPPDAADRCSDCSVEASASLAITLFVQP
jgi:hypothetical protein